MTPFQRELESARINSPASFSIHRGLWGGWEIRWNQQRISQIHETKQEAIETLFDLISPSFQSELDKVEWIENLGEDMPQSLAVLAVSF